MKISLPPKVDYIINKLIYSGYDAYAVGGCVRDSLLHKEPMDWDITTSAKPEEVKTIFKRTIDTGIEHGTVTVMLDKEGYEVTTYRIDGEYEDNRHPKQVAFTEDLIEDLKRRDFTINAMAYNDTQGLVDVFGGQKDLEEGIVRCVGNPDDRFDEDALRILRAIRFSAQLGFEIDEETLRAVRSKAMNLNHISAERIRTELCKLLVSDHPEKLLVAYETGITKVILPEFDAMMVTEQNNPHHSYSVGIHTIKAVQEVATVEGFTEKEKLILRWAMLLHDVEKPSCFFIGEDGKAHFWGHQEKGAATSKNILKRLRFDNETIEYVFRLVKWHDYEFTLRETPMRRAIHKMGADLMHLLFEIKRGDMLAQNPATIPAKLQKLEEAKKLTREIEAKGQCVDLKMLHINGKDLISIGFVRGKAIGEVLNQLLEEVLEEPSLNEREILLEKAEKYLKANPLFLKEE